MEKHGAFMKTTKTSYESKHAELLDKAHELSKRNAELRAEQIRLGKISESQLRKIEKDATKNNYVSKETLEGLAEAKNKLNEML